VRGAQHERGPAHGRRITPGEAIVSGSEPLPLPLTARPAELGRNGHLEDRGRRRRSSGDVLDDQHRVSSSPAQASGGGLRRKIFTFP
jgi:hypothetical protein